MGNSPEGLGGHKESLWLEDEGGEGCVEDGSDRRGPGHAGAPCGFDSERGGNHCGALSRGCQAPPAGDPPWGSQGVGSKEAG